MYSMLRPFPLLKSVFCYLNLKLKSNNSNFITTLIMCDGVYYGLAWTNGVNGVAVHR